MMFRTLERDANNGGVSIHIRMGGRRELAIGCMRG